ncbi:MAG: hypothetical protein NT029_01435, partial [Armatimonadetes bacterium]|nr:hypothetical protein [Armatimonadota bacterium]
LTQRVRGRARGWRGEHLAYGRFPYGHESPSLVPRLVSELRVLLRLRPTTLDYTIDSLRTIDRKVGRSGLPERSGDASLYAHLVAYAGETAVRAVLGTWQIVYNEEGEVFEANVLAPGGVVIRPWLEIANDAEEGGQWIAELMKRAIFVAGGRAAVVRASRSVARTVP